jgi:hypothetical protein
MEHNDFIQAKQLIFADIQREINLAYLAENTELKVTLEKAGINGGGNFLAALGLLSYTEFVGKIKYRKKHKGRDCSSKNFNAFYNDLGSYYKEFNDGLDGDKNVYDIFRCGLVHEYFIKKNCVIYMLEKQGLHGVGMNKNGNYYFVVETYFKDFKKALELHEKKSPTL